MALVRLHWECSAPIRPAQDVESATHWPPLSHSDLGSLPGETLWKESTMITFFKYLKACNLEEQLKFFGGPPE